VIRVLLLTVIAASAVAAQDTVFTWSGTLPTGGRFAVRNYNGLIDVRPGSSDRIEVRVTTSADVRTQAKKLSFDVRESSATDVEICTVFSGLNVCDGEELFGDFRDGRIKVRYTIDLPKGMRFRASTGSGDIIVMQSAADVDVSTGSGDVVVRESESGVTATTGSGDVTVAAANGAVRASTGNGDVLVMTSLGPVNASSGNGSVDVQMGFLPSMPDNASMSITSGNGKVKVTLPGDFNGQLDASTGNGDVKSEFDVRGSSGRGDSRLRGAIGSGNGPLVRIHSGNGSLTIRKG
jgi:hypothetical protein